MHVNRKQKPIAKMGLHVLSNTCFSTHSEVPAKKNLIHQLCKLFIHAYVRCVDRGETEFQTTGPFTAQMFPTSYASVTIEDGVYLSPLLTAPAVSDPPRELHIAIRVSCPIRRIQVCMIEIGLASGGAQAWCETPWKRSAG